MPKFPKVESTATLLAALPVTSPSPAAFGGLEARSLERLGGVLTQLGVKREQAATRLERERRLTGCPDARPAGPRGERSRVRDGLV